jgi:murein DD-endopeptidase MepM/ murein hydrolase activator NlpD
MATRPSWFGLPAEEDQYYRPTGGLLDIGPTPEEELIEQLRLQEEERLRLEAEAEWTALQEAEAAAAVATEPEPEPVPAEETVEEEPKAKRSLPSILIEDMADPAAKVVIEDIEPTAAQMAERSGRDEVKESLAVEDIDAVTPLRRHYETIVAGFLANNPKASAKEVMDFATNLSDKQFGGEFKGFTKDSVEEVLAFVAKNPGSERYISFTNDVLTPEQRAERDAAIAAATNEKGEVDLDKLQRPLTGQPGAAMAQQLRGGLAQTTGGLMQAVGSDLSIAFGKVGEDLRLRGQELAASGRNMTEMADPGYEPGTPEYYAYNIAKSTVDMVPLVAGGAIAGTAKATAMIMAPKVFGQAYDQSITEGRTHEQAMMDGTFRTLFEVVPEKMALDVILGPAAGVASAAVKGGVAEMAQELLTEAANIGYDMGVLTKDVPAKEVLQRLMDAGIIGGGTGAGLGAGVQATRSAAESQWVEAVADRWAQRMATKELEGAEFKQDPTAVAARRFVPQSKVVIEDIPRTKVAKTPEPVSEDGEVETFAIPDGRVTSRFGPRHSFRTNNGKRASTNHAGVDIALPEGAPAPAGASGVVTRAGRAGGYGNQVVIQHADGTYSSYSHLSEIGVKVGDRVAQGDVVGAVGQTGNATGPHLHLERRNADGVPVNPLNGRTVKGSKKGDDTPWEVAEEPYDNEESDPFPLDEMEQTLLDETGVELVDEAEIDEPEPPAPVAAQEARNEAPLVTAAAEVLGTVSRVDEVSSRVRDRLDQRQGNNVAAQALEELRSELRGEEAIPGMAENEVPLYDEDGATIIGFHDPETGANRMVEGTEVPQAPSIAGGQTDFVSMSSPVDLATTPEIEGGSEVFRTTPTNIEVEASGLTTTEGAPFDAEAVALAHLGPEQQAMLAEARAAEQPAPALAEPAALEAINAKAEAYEDKLWGLEVDAEKPAVKRFAQRLVRDGVIEQAELDGLAYMFKDRDMGAEDIASELRTSIQIWADNQKKGLTSGYTGDAASQRTEAGGLPLGRGVSGSAGPVVGVSRADTLFDLPLKGAPGPVNVAGVGEVQFGQHRPAVNAAETYMETAGFTYSPPTEYASLDKARATKIALAYEKMKHDPQNPEVRAAYSAMIEETVAQYRVIEQTGLQIEFIDLATGGDPYAVSPRLAQLDVAQNNHLWVFKTDDGFGDTPISEADIADNPMLALTDITIGGHQLRANDVFRIVHDYFGHIKDGHGFRARGEENAWQSHASMYSPLARRAMTTETRGQNSWVNYGPNGAKNRSASSAETSYAPQKVGLLPKWVSEEGFIGGKTDGQRKQRKLQVAARDRRGGGIPTPDSGTGTSGAVLTRPPTDAAGNVTLDHWSLEEGLSSTDPVTWGRSSKWLPEEERGRMGVAPKRTYFGIASEQPGGYVNEFHGDKHPRFGTPVTRYTAKVPLSKLYDMENDPDGLREYGRSLPKHPNGRYIYKDHNLSPSIPGIDGVSLYEQLIKDAGYKGYWIKSGLGMVAAVYEPVPVAKVTPKPKAAPKVADKLTSRERRTEFQRTSRIYKDNILRQVKAIYKAMGDDGLIPVNIVDRIVDELGNEGAGSYDRTDNVVRILALATDVRGVARHEAVHWAVENRVWEPEEWAVLKRWAASQPGLMAWAKENYPHLSQPDQLEEAVAEGFSRWRGGQLGAELGPIGTLFQKLADFIAMVRRAFTQSGISRGEMKEAIELLGEFENGQRLKKWRAAQTKAPSFGRRQWHYDLSREMMSGNIDPAQHNFLRQQPGERFQTAWHGSPKEDIDQFSLDFIGTGEGAQAFGWGLYFAEKKDVAAWYKRKLTMGHKDPVDEIIQVDGKPIRQWTQDFLGTGNAYINTAQYEVADRIFSYLTTNKPYNGWIDALDARFYNEASEMIAAAEKAGNIQERDELVATARAVERVFEAVRNREITQKSYPEKGALYKVEVPNKNDLLDLDKTLQEQAPKVKAALEKVHDHIGKQPELFNELQEWIGRGFWNWSGHELQMVLRRWEDALPTSGHKGASGISDTLDNAIEVGHLSMAASIYLRNLGIPGSTYLDRDSRMNIPGEPLTNNFVIFDDSAIQLKAKLRVVRSSLASSPLSDPTNPNPGIFRRIHDQTMAFLGALAFKDVDASDNLVDAFKRKVTQRYQQIVKTQRRAEAILGVDRMAPGMNPMEMITADERGYKLGHLTDNAIRPMAIEMAQRGVSMEDLGLYLYARHAPARNARIAKINPKFSKPDSPGSGMTDQEAADIMKEFADAGTLGDMQALATYIDAMIDMAQQERLRGGLISQVDINNGFQPGDFYVPLRGNESLEPELEMDFALAAKRGGGFSVAGQEGHRMFGRESKADLAEIVGYTITQAQEAIDRAYRNQISQNILQMLRAIGDRDFARIDRVKRVATLNRKTGKVEYQDQTRVTDPKEQQRTLYVKENGSVTKITFNDQNPSAMRFVKAAKNLGIESLPTVLRWTSLYTRLFTKSNTQWNVDFILANAVKDVQTGVLNASTLNQKGLRRAIIKNLLSMKPLFASWWGATHPAGSGYGKGKKWDTYYAEFNENGGKINYNEVEPIADALKTARREIKNAQRGGLSPVKAIIKVGEMIDRANSAFENMTRLAAYAALRDAGVPAKQAAVAVKELTTNFQQHGEWGPKVNAAYGFANASIIGSSRFIYTLSKKPQIIGGLVLVGMITDLINSMWDDEWDDYTEEEKDANFMILLPEAMGFDIKIPIGYGLNAIITAGRKMSELWRGKKKEDGTRMTLADAAGDFMWSSARAFLPISGSTWANFVVPTIGDPFVDIWQNQNNWGRPLRPEQSIRKEDQKPMSQLAFDSTGQFWVGLAEGLNAVGGGNAVIPGLGALDNAPSSYRHVFEQTVGGAGRSVTRTIELGASALAGEAVAPNDIPVARRFMARPYGAANADEAQVSAFYSRINESRVLISQAESQIEIYGKDSPTYQRFRKGNEPIIEFAETVKKAQSRLDKLNKAKNALERSQTNLEGLNKKDQKVILKNTGVLLKSGRKPTEEEVAKVKDRIEAKRLSLATAFNEKWLEEVMKEGPQP